MAVLLRELGARICYCPSCDAPVVDTVEKWAQHLDRVHPKKHTLIRKIPHEVIEPFAHLRERYNRRRGRPSKFVGDQDTEFLCDACRNNNCLACDGGDCRCVCSLELDEKRKVSR